eukprot:3159845-Alexandrium_andersonii.AAC.1
MEGIGGPPAPLAGCQPSTDRVAPTVQYVVQLIQQACPHRYTHVSARGGLTGFAVLLRWPRFLGHVLACV